MGTRSDIIVQLSNGTYSRIYCHFDGYLDHNGKLLYGHYNSQELAEKLITLGDLSTLGEITGTKHSFEWQTKLHNKHKPKGQQFGTDFDAMHRDPLYKKYRRMCLAYGRDRGEKDCEAANFPSLAAAMPGADTWTEFTYVWSREMEGFETGAWWVGDADEGTQGLKLLSEALCGVVTVKPLIKAPWGVIGSRA